MPGDLNDYSQLLQTLAPPQQRPVNATAPPPLLAAPQPQGIPLNVQQQLAATPPTAPPPQGGQETPPTPTKTFTEAPPSGDEGMSGLSTFLSGASDSTNSGRFLMDLGIRLLQAPQQGQSQLSHIAASASGALNKLEAAKASEAEGKGRSEVREEQLATSRRTRASADLRDELTRAKIKDLGEVKGGGKPAAGVQQQQANIKILRKQYPKHFPTDESAGAYLLNKKQAEALGVAKAKAQADFRATNELIFSDNPEGFAAAIEGVGEGFEAEIVKLNIPDLTQEPAVPAAKAVKPSSEKGRLAEEFKAGGWEGVPALLETKLGRTPTEAEIASVRKNIFGERKKVKAKAKVRTSRKDARVTAAKKRRAAKKVKAATDSGKDAALSGIENAVNTMTRPELQVWLEKNKQHLSPAQRKQVRTKIVALKKGK